MPGDEKTETFVDGNTTTTVTASVYDDGDERRPVISKTVVIEQDKVNASGNTKSETTMVESRLNNYNSGLSVNTTNTTSRDYRPNGTTRTFTHVHDEERTYSPTATNVAAGHDDPLRTTSSEQTTISFNSKEQIKREARHAENLSSSFASSDDLVAKGNNFSELHLHLDPHQSVLTIDQQRNGRQYSAQITPDQSHYSYQRGNKTYELSADRDGTVVAQIMREDADAAQTLGTNATNSLLQKMERMADRAVVRATEGQYRNTESYLDHIDGPTGSNLRLDDAFRVSPEAVSEAREQLDSLNAPKIEENRAETAEVLLNAVKENLGR